MWKQIIPADDIFIHGENSSWKILPHTNTSCNGSGPMQVQSFKKAAASELPNFSGWSSASCSLWLTPGTCLRQQEHGQGRNGLGDKEGLRSVVRRAMGKGQRESAFKEWHGAMSSPGWWYGKQWPCIILYSSFSSGLMWKGQPLLQQPVLIITHHLLVLGSMQ